MHLLIFDSGLYTSHISTTSLEIYDRIMTCEDLFHLQPFHWRNHPSVCTYDFFRVNILAIRQLMKSSPLMATVCCAGGPGKTALMGLRARRHCITLSNCKSDNDYASVIIRS